MGRLLATAQTSNTPVDSLGDNYTITIPLAFQTHTLYDVIPAL